MVSIEGVRHLGFHAGQSKTTGRDSYMFFVADGVPVMAAYARVESAGAGPSRAIFAGRR